MYQAGLKPGRIGYGRVIYEYQVLGKRQAPEEFISFVMVSGDG